MSGGGDEKAVFEGLRADAEKSLPKIAEKHADVVQSTVEKGTSNLAAHAANESDLADTFHSAMPDNTPVNAPKPSTDIPAQATGPGSSRIAQALDSGTDPAVEPPTSDPATIDSAAAYPAGVDPATPQLGRDTLNDGPDFNTLIDQELNARGLDRAEHDILRTSPTNDLTDPQIQQVVDVRNSITIGRGQIITKVLGQDVADAYLQNAEAMPNGREFNPQGFGGSIARGTDTADLTTPAKLRDSLALDDQGAGWSPVPEGTSEAYQLRMKSPAGLEAPTTFGAVNDPVAAQHVADLAGASTPGRPWQSPFTGTGYTGGGIPEWDAARSELPSRAEIWKISSDGSESLAGYFDGTRWTRTNG